jgi:methylamine--corrinoid protein Co-methyltransferase
VKILVELKLIRSIDIQEIAKRIETGHLQLQDHYNMKVVSPTAEKLSKECRIEYDPDHFLMIDAEKADRIWDAAIQLLADAGFYCSNNRRQVKFTREEILECVQHPPTRISIGKGKDERELYPRKVQDQKAPIIFGGSFNADIDPEITVPFNTAYAKEQIIDILYNPGQITKLDGIHVRMNSPLEMLSVIQRAKMTREALRRAGRPDMACVTQSSSFCGIASYNPSWGFRDFDLQSDPMISPLTIHDSMMTKLAFFQSCGIPLYMGSVPLIGGFAGGPLGTAILCVAEKLTSIILGATVTHFGAQHIQYGQQSNPQSLWASLLVNQAISRNSDIIHTTSIITSARPGHSQYFTEIAGQTIASVICGSHVTGPRAAKLRRINQNTPLAARFMGEVAHASLKLSNNEALEIIHEIYRKYEQTQRLSDHDYGKSFEELYDLKTLQPTPEHEKQYLDNKTWLQNLGLPLKG